MSSDARIVSLKRARAYTTAGEELDFTYTHSPDNVDHNLMMTFHGYGDDNKNIHSHVTRFQLPQTAVLSVNGIHKMPLEMPGRGWWSLHDGFGQDASDDSKQDDVHKSQQVITALIDYIINECGWKAGNIFLFGFSQGGAFATHICLSLPQYTFGGLVCVGTSLDVDGKATQSLLRVGEQIHLPSTVLLIHGEHDAVTPVDVAKKAYLTLMRIANRTGVKIVFKMFPKQHGPIASRAEADVLFPFLARAMPRRNLSLEKMVRDGEVAEVVSMDKQ